MYFFTDKSKKILSRIPIQVVRAIYQPEHLVLITKKACFRQDESALIICGSESRISDKCNSGFMYKVIYFQYFLKT
jgi:hypothetical protein